MPLSVAVAITLVLCILTINVRRQVAAIPLLLGTIVIPFGISLDIGPLHLYMFRLLILAGWIRLICRGQYRLGRFRPTDLVFLCFAFSGMIAYIALRQDAASLVNALGSMFNAVGAYFFFRCTIRDMDDVSRIAKVLSVVTIVIAVCIVIENKSHQNLFTGGGVEIREGRVRCQGPFGHPILAGMFAATVMPVLATLWWKPKGKPWVVLGVAACLVVIGCAACSGPILTCAAAFAGLLLWPLRAHLRLIRWSIAAVIVTLHLIMKAPVWALIARVSIFGASSSDHRFRLVDGFIDNFEQWWLIGTIDNANWGWMTWDASNGYVRIGLDGGLLTLILFFVLVGVSFTLIGRALRTVKNRSSSTQKCIWGLGTALFAHLVAFFGVNYWDQSIIMWYLLLAIITCVSIHVQQTYGRKAVGGGYNGTN